jgi:D-glycero-D-manno-heptose 1,7-bisphosphate phosphatase
MKLIILDRDGVINEDSDDFIKSPTEWQAVPGSMQAIARLHRNDWHVVVATNQSGIARGLFDRDALMQIHEKMHAAAAETGGRIDAVFFCPHGPDEGCDCRKPKPGLPLDISQRLKMELEGVPAIGDSLSDIQAATAAGAAPILVRTGKGIKTSELPDFPDDVPVYDDLASAVDALLRRQPDSRP